MTREDRYYPHAICLDCGHKHGRPRAPSAAIGMWNGECGWCGKTGPVTSPRDFCFPEYTGDTPEGWGK